MSKYVTMEEDAIKTLCGAVKKLNSVSDAIDDENLSEKSAYSNLKTQQLIDAIPTVTVDSTLDTTSENPVQNKVVATALNDKLGLDGGTLNSGSRINIPSSASGVGTLIDGNYITIDDANTNKSSTITADGIDTPSLTVDGNDAIHEGNIGDYVLSKDSSRPYYSLGAWVSKENIGDCDFGTLLYSVFNRTNQAPFVISGFVDEGTNTLYSSIRTAIFGSEIALGYGVLTFVVENTGMMEITYNLTHQNGTYINMYQGGQLRGWRSLDIKDEVLSLDGGELNKDASIIIDDSENDLKTTITAGNIDLTASGMGGTVKSNDVCVSWITGLNGKTTDDIDFGSNILANQNVYVSGDLKVGGKDVIHAGDNVNNATVKMYGDGALNTSIILTNTENTAQQTYIFPAEIDTPNLLVGGKKVVAPTFEQIILDSSNSDISIGQCEMDICDMGSYVIVNIGGSFETIGYTKVNFLYNNSKYNSANYVAGANNFWIWDGTSATAPTLGALVLTTTGIKLTLNNTQESAIRAMGTVTIYKK